MRPDHAVLPWTSTWRPIGVDVGLTTKVVG